LQPGSAAYQTLLRWIEAGAPYDPAKEPALERLDVTPPEALMEPGKPTGAQQLRVIAHFSDGHREDVTAGALFSSQDEGIAKVDNDGAVTALRSGDTFIIVGYLGQFSRFHALVPNAQPLAADDWKLNNYIDDAIHAKLRLLRIPPAALCDDA